MSGRILEEVIAEVRERTDIVEVIGRHVELKRSGSNVKGLCPFHDEKTPSFNVNPARQFFYCFGCQASGDVIHFLMKIEGRGFNDIVEDLASRAGVELRRDERRSSRQIEDDSRRRDEKNQALELNARVAKLYSRYLESEGGEQARGYVDQRGIGVEVIEAFQLGFAPPSGAVVAKRLEQHGADLELAERYGLIAKRRKGSGFHDRFWNRLIFPLTSVSGDVIGFGGRLLGDGDGPKYVNTPETPVFRKGNALYGIYQAGSAIRRAGAALLVEGNFDVLQLHQHGLTHAVAPLGTALTVAQARLLRRFAERAIAIFDGDEAGRKAALRAVPILLEGGLEPKIATLPPGEDPDSVLHEQGRAALDRLIERATPGVDYLIAEQRKTMEDSIPARARLIESIAPVIRLLPTQVARHLYVDRLALDLGVDRGAVQRAVRGERSAARAATAQQGDSGQTEGKARRIECDPRELDLLRLVIEHPRLLARAERVNLASLLTNAELRATYSAAAEMQRETGRIDLNSLLSKTPPPVRDAVASVALSKDFSTDGDPNRALDDWIATQVASRLKTTLGEIQRRIAAAEADGDGERTRVWVERMMALKNLRQLIDRSRLQADALWEYVPELIEVEREIHETR